MPAILNSGMPPFTVALLVSLTLISISSLVSPRMISPSSFAESTVSPGVKTLASMLVVMPISRSYPVSVSWKPSAFSRMPSSTGIELRCVTALDTPDTAADRRVRSQMIFMGNAPFFIERLFKRKIRIDVVIGAVNL